MESWGLQLTFRDLCRDFKVAILDVSALVVQLGGPACSPDDNVVVGVRPACNVCRSLRDACTKTGVHMMS